LRFATENSEEPEKAIWVGQVKTLSEKADPRVSWEIVQLGNRKRG
jgi:hypothetical protein